MKQVCSVSGEEFIVSDADLVFYDHVAPRIQGTKLSVPPPTLSPRERQRRRFAFRNERHLYRRKCDLTKKPIISNYAKEAEITVYDQEAWWSDRWDAKTYAQDFDFSRPFFEQFHELQQKVPQLALSVWNSENSEFCNYVGHVKDCYLIFGPVYSEDCYYGSPYYSKDCLDTLVVRNCEVCYECIDCRELYECLYCQDCHSSRGLLCCFDLLGCADCIGCAGLRKKQYYIFNQSHSKEEYEAFKSKLNLCNIKDHEILRSGLKRVSLEVPHRHMQSNQVENASGNYVYQSKNVHDSFYADRCEDCRYCAQVVDLKDCYDTNYTEENELCYEYLGAYQNERLLFSKFCNKVSDALYCDSCFTSNDLFGCTGMRNARYCVMNKEYSKDEYEKLVLKIFAHMQETKEWGEFFPVHYSPFAYNLTVAEEYYPLSADSARSRGYAWRDEKDEIPQVSRIIRSAEIAREVGKAPEDILDCAIECEESGRPFRILKKELDFYGIHKLPLPAMHPDVRHARRLEKRNPRQLWLRGCDCCGREIRTTYAPDRQERVYCEGCYLKEVY